MQSTGYLKRWPFLLLAAGHSAGEAFAKQHPHNTALLHNMGSAYILLGIHGRVFDNSGKSKPRACLKPARQARGLIITVKPAARFG